MLTFKTFFTIIQELDVDFQVFLVLRYSLCTIYLSSPLTPPPKYILYLPGALPINAISASAGLAQPFGHQSYGL